MTAAEPVTVTGEPTDLAAWVGKTISVYPAWDTLHRAPFTTGTVEQVIRGTSVVVRDTDGWTRVWPISLPIEEVP